MKKRKSTFHPTHQVISNHKRSVVFLFDRNKFKTACIFHGSDFDGQLSGALIRYHNRIHKNEDVLMVSADYHYDAKTIEDEILICDTV